LFFFPLGLAQETGTTNHPNTQLFYKGLFL